MYDKEAVCQNLIDVGIYAPHTEEEFQSLVAAHEYWENSYKNLVELAKEQNKDVFDLVHDMASAGEVKPMLEYLGAINEAINEIRAKRYQQQ